MDGRIRIPVTSQEVAKRAGVSQSAVSRTFTPGASVSRETRRKVLVAAKALGYRPNAIARSLITRRSRIIALVMGYLQNQFYPLVIEQLSQSLQKRGYHLLMFISDTDDVDEVLAEILQYQVDGIVMASVTLSTKLAQSCADAGVPVVMLNRVPIVNAGDSDSVSSVISDNYRGGRLAAQLLLDRGHQRIAFLAGLENSSTSIEREKGFTEVLRGARKSIFRRAVGDYSFEGAQKAARELFIGENRPDAVFVANDHMAIAAMDVLRIELGLRIPEDVSMIGFDDIPQAAWGSYRLTTLTQSVQDMVIATVDLLQRQMKGEVSPHRIVIPCKLIERSTVREVSPVPMPIKTRTRQENDSKRATASPGAPRLRNRRGA